jgi:GNAT superfamily N-acetyltransferase
MRGGDFGELAHVAGRPMGAAWARLFPVDAPGYGFVVPEIPELSVAVLAGHRNRGIGSALLERLIHRAKARAPGLSLSVSTHNPARALYLRNGFKTVDQSGDSLVMLLTWQRSAGAL